MRMSVRTKLFGAFGVVIALMVVLGFVAIAKLGSVNSRATYLGATSIPSAPRSRRVYESASANYRRVQNRLIFAAEKDQPQFLKENSRRSRPTRTRRFARYAEMKSDARNQELYAQTRSARGPGAPRQPGGLRRADREGRGRGGQGAADRVAGAAGRAQHGVGRLARLQRQAERRGGGRGRRHLPLGPHHRDQAAGRGERAGRGPRLPADPLDHPSAWARCCARRRASRRATSTRTIDDPLPATRSARPARAFERMITYLKDTGTRGRSRRRR